MDEQLEVRREAFATIHDLTVNQPDVQDAQPVRRCPQCGTPLTERPYIPAGR